MQSGDIDSSFRDSSAMHRGSAAHRKIQKAAGECYQKEVSLKLDLKIDDIHITLQGRADGIITNDDGAIMIDEIKSTTMPLDALFRQHEQHLAQGKCYAYMYLQTLENRPESIAVQLTYYHLESQEIKRHEWGFTSEQLEIFFDDLIDKYAYWLRFERDWVVTRDESIAHTDFPFEKYRSGQRELAVAAYRCILAQKKLYAAAPTGIGKTLSVLFPSIKAMRESHVDKLFYLTAKTVTRAVAEDAVRLMAAKHGLRMKVVTLRAKEKVCPGNDGDGGGKCACNPEQCSRARGHFDRINDALADLLENNDLITADVVTDYARKHRVCPHEYALDASLWCDLIIGDYNHVFDPTVYLRRFFGSEKEPEDKNYTFLIDEAHNLADRVRDMYTVALSKAAFGFVRGRLRGKDSITRALRKALRDINTYLSDVRKKRGHQQNYVQPEQDLEFKELVILFFVAAGEWLAANKNNIHEVTEDLLKLYFDVQKFLLISEIYDEHFVSITEMQNNDTIMTLFCLDPSNVIAAMLARGKAAIIFSATLTPLPYYRDILGGNENDIMLSLPSPFDPARLAIAAHCGISTKYTDRQSSYTPIAEAIAAVISRKSGNYFVFFPSYDYMHMVHEVFTQKHPEIRTLLQKGEMAEEKREAFLREFDDGNTEALVGFVVLGGIFSEGIDLKGGRLIGSIIVSVGIPPISLRADLIRSYFDRRNGQGYDYAYTFPGMNKVLQAAGRVIRTETDEGIVLLIDSRYSWAKYRGLMPVHWTNVYTLWNTRDFEKCYTGGRSHVNYV